MPRSIPRKQLSVLISTAFATSATSIAPIQPATVRLSGVTALVASNAGKGVSRVLPSIWGYAPPRVGARSGLMSTPRPWEHWKRPHEFVVNTSGTPVSRKVDRLRQASSQPIPAGFTRAVRSSVPGLRTHASGSVKVYAPAGSVRSGVSTTVSPSLRIAGPASGWMVPSDHAVAMGSERGRHARDPGSRSRAQVRVHAHHGLAEVPQRHLTGPDAVGTPPHLRGGRIGRGVRHDRLDRLGDLHVIDLHVERAAGHGRLRAGSAGTPTPGGAHGGGAAPGTTNLTHLGAPPRSRRPRHRPRRRSRGNPPPPRSGCGSGPVRCRPCRPRAASEAPFAGEPSHAPGAEVGDVDQPAGVDRQLP